MELHVLYRRRQRAGDRQARLRHLRDAARYGDILNLAAEGVAFLKEIDHPILREQTRDYFVNQQFRKDIYVRGATRLSPLDQRERLLNSRFALIQTPELIPLKISQPVGEIGLQEAVYNPLIAELAAKNHAPKTLRELAASLPPSPGPNCCKRLPCWLAWAARRLASAALGSRCARVAMPSTAICASALLRSEHPDAGQPGNWWWNFGQPVSATLFARSGPRQEAASGMGTVRLAGYLSPGAEIDKRG